VTDLQDKARAILENHLRELTTLNHLSREARDTVSLDQQSVGRLSRMDALQQQAMAQATERQRMQEMARIKAALRRLDNGDYGACLDCGENIAERRLEIDPTATLCISCAQKR